MSTEPLTKFELDFPSLGARQRIRAYLNGVHGTYNEPLHYEFHGTRSGRIPATGINMSNTPKSLVAYYPVNADAFL